MIGFRQTDARYPFLWEGAGQPAGRWHADDEGPVHYFADTPYGAWAEFLRHEEITDPEDLATVRRQIWAVDIGTVKGTRVTLSAQVLTGGLDTWPQCQAESRRLRGRGARRLLAPSAALLPAGATGAVIDNGVQSASSQDGTVVVLFGRSRELVGWVVADAARPPEMLLDRVRHFSSG